MLHAILPKSAEWAPGMTKVADRSSRGPLPFEWTSAKDACLRVGIGAKTHVSVTLLNGDAGITERVDVGAVPSAGVWCVRQSATVRIEASGDDPAWILWSTQP